MIEDITKKTPKILSKSPEDKERGPKLKVKIFFSTHSDPESANTIKEDFKECDIFIPEMVDWDNSQEESWNSLSKGTIKPEDFIKQFIKLNFPEYLYAQSKIIYKSQKPILFIDLGYSHQILKDIDKNDKIRSDKLDKDENFDDIFKTTKEFVLKYAQLNKQREQIMVDSIHSRIKSFLNENPGYKNKKELQILISLGVTHTPVFHKLKSEGIDISMKFKSLPHAFGVQSQITRAVAFNKEVTEDMVARCVLRSFIAFWFYEKLVKMEETEGSVEKAADKLEVFLRFFNYGDIKSLFSNGKNKTEFKKKLVNLLSDRNLKVPEFLE